MAMQAGTRLRELAAVMGSGSLIDDIMVSKTLKVRRSNHGSPRRSLSVSARMVNSVQGPGENFFRSMGGSQQLCEWSFHVSLPGREGRTEGELVQEVRLLGVERIYQECQNVGLDLSLDDLNQLNSDEFLEGSRQ